MVVVGACRYVDEVVADAPMPFDAAFLDAHGIDLVVHGDDMTEEDSSYWYGAAIARGIFAVVPYTLDVSTTELLRRVADRQ